MRPDRRIGLVFVVAALAASALAAPSEEPPAGKVVLTGSLSAADGEIFAVPVTSNWQLTLKWLISEGEAVEPGQSIALLDPAGVQDRLHEIEVELTDKLQSRASEEAQGKLTRLDLDLALKRADVEYRKARIDADVPQDVLDGVDYRQRQLEMAKKQLALEQAQSELLNQEFALRAKLAEIDVEITEHRSDRDRLLEELESLDLRATRPGIVVHAEHPWHGRKVLEGDRLQATFPVATIPDLDTLEVEAWAGENDAVRLEPGQSVVMRLDAFPERRFDGTVKAVAAAGEQRPMWGRASYFRVRIAIHELDKEIMKPGMSARCVIVAGAGAARSESS